MLPINLHGLDPLLIQKESVKTSRKIGSNWYYIKSDQASIPNSMFCSNWY
jgi:hypothetical protein